MMKKLLSYTLPLALAAGTAAGCQNCEREIKEEVPTQVISENVRYHEFEKGKPVCLYYDNGGQFSDNDGDNEPGSYAAIFDIKIIDPNGIRQTEEVPLSFKEKEYGRPQVMKDRKSERKYTIGLGSPSPRKDLSTIIRVTDWQGNVTEHKLTLEEVLKNAKPMLAKPKTTKWCPEKIDVKGSEGYWSKLLHPSTWSPPIGIPFLY